MATQPDENDKNRRGLHWSIVLFRGSLEDAIALKLVSEEQFRNAISEDKCVNFFKSLNKKTGNEDLSYDKFVQHLFGDGSKRKREISRLVHHFIIGVYSYSEGEFENEILKFRVKINSDDLELLNALKKFVSDKLIRSPSVQHLEFKGQQMVLAVFEAFLSDPKSFLPEITYQKYVDDGEDMRVICDHVAGMTDHYLLRTFDRLFSPRMGSVFDRLSVG